MALSAAVNVDVSRKIRSEGKGIEEIFFFWYPSELNCHFHLQASLSAAIGSL